MRWLFGFMWLISMPLFADDNPPEDPPLDWLWSAQYAVSDVHFEDRKNHQNFNGKSFGFGFGYTRLAEDWFATLGLNLATGPLDQEMEAKQSMEFQSSALQLSVGLNSLGQNLRQEWINGIWLGSQFFSCEGKSMLTQRHGTSGKASFHSEGLNLGIGLFLGDFSNIADRKLVKETIETKFAGYLFELGFWSPVFLNYDYTSKVSDESYQKTKGKFKGITLKAALTFYLES